MNNIQKSFKQKAKRGLRECYANGGLLESFEKRQAEWDTAASNSGGFNTLPANFGMDTRPTAQSTLDGIVGNSNLSGRQKARAAMALNTNGALDTSGIRGLSANQNAALTVDQFNADAGIKKRQAQTGLALADGGMIDPVEAQLAAMKAKYGGVGSPQAAAPAPAPLPTAPAPAPQRQAPQPAGFMDRLRSVATGGLDRRMQAAGMAEGGIVRGKGGPTDDEVPMVINGKPVNLSNTEAVLPAKTVTALGGPEAVEELIEKTNGKPPVRSGLRAGGEYAGGVVDPEALMQDVAKRRGLDYQPPAPSTDPAQAPTDPSTDGRRQYSTPTAPAFVYTGREPTLATAPAPTLTLPAIDKEGAAKALAEAKKQGRFQYGDDLPGVIGLRAAGVQGALGPDTVVDGKTAKTGIRTIDTATGQKVYAGRDAKGQLHVSSGGGLSQSESDAASDARFAAAGTKKDAYGNWMSQQRLGDKAALSEIQKERTLNDAFNPEITDPHVQAAARAKLGLGLAQEQIASKNAVEQAKLMLDQAKYNSELAKDKQAQANTDRTFKASQDEKRTKRINDTLDRFAPTAGLKDDDLKKAQKHRADLEQALMAAHGGNLPDDMDVFDKNLPSMVNQARLTLAMRNAIENRGIFRKMGNIFGPNPMTTLNNEVPREEKGTLIDDLVFGNGIRVSAADVFGNDADLLAAYKERVAQQKKSK